MRVFKYITFFLLFLFFLNLNAAEITKVKGKKVMISTQGDEISEGEKYFALDDKGKRKAIIKITKVKGEKALGAVLKGKAGPQMTLAKGKEKAKSSTSSASGDLAFGAMLNYSLDSMTVKNLGTGIADQELSGSGFGFTAAADYKVFSNVYLRGLLGYETFSTEGEILPAPLNIKASVEFSMITFGAMARYAFLDGPTRAWAGVGFGYYSPMSTNANLLEDAGGFGALSVGGGADIEISDTMYLPVQFDYNMAMGQTDADISVISIRTGLMFKF